MRYPLTFSAGIRSLRIEWIRRASKSGALVLATALMVSLFPPKTQAESWNDMFKGMARDMIEEGTRAIRESNDRSDRNNRQQQPYEQQPHQPYQQPQQQYQYQQPAQQPVQRSSQYSRAQIQDIQTRLQMLGYNPGPADGLFGDKTAKAIAQFEIDQGLPVTGKPGRTLIIALHSAVAQSNRSYQAGAGARAGQSIGQSASSRSELSPSVPDMSKDPTVQAMTRCMNAYTQCRRQSLASPQVCAQQYRVCLVGEPTEYRPVKPRKESAVAHQKLTPSKPESVHQKAHKLPDPDPIEEVKATAIAAAQTLNAAQDKDVSVGKQAEVPQIDQRELQLKTSTTRRTLITTSPTEFFWTSMGNELNQAATTLHQVNERNKALRRHARKLHKALEVCCSCSYRNEILDEFIKWQAEALWSTQVTQNAMGTLQGNVDFGHLIPSREQDRERLIAMAPPPCEPPTDIPEPSVEANDRGISVNRKVDWGLVPDNFRLPTPPKKQTRGDLLYTAHVQIPGRLRTTAIDYYNRHRLPGYDDLTRIEEDIYEKDVAPFRDDPVLHCYYVSPDFQGSKVIRYWYRKRPDEFDANYLRSRLRNHPILHIRAPNDKCPQDIDTAMAMQF
ncbi:peptidoglycan-binding domain-containing protein [Marinobacterium rhizophilum]|uniref:peptidoglycan-binding domain-containing protein n=1 Tax=Marinobacterium rhizophilum TaxID=420402 RepID=UPI000375E354|nr:peptidoglycan-binding domain-containing protein [Marinobacterium rhizophilum]